MMLAIRLRALHLYRAFSAAVPTNTPDVSVDFDPAVGELECDNQTTPWFTKLIGKALQKCMQVTPESKTATDVT